jgi:hypothetical protein
MDFVPGPPDRLRVPRVNLHDPAILTGWWLVHELPAIEFDPTDVLVADPDVNMRRLDVSLACSPRTETALLSRPSASVANNITYVAVYRIRYICQGEKAPPLEAN